MGARFVADQQRLAAMRSLFISIEFDDTAGITRTTGTAFFEIALLVTVGIFVGMYDEAAPIGIEQA